MTNSIIGELATRVVDLEKRLTDLEKGYLDTTSQTFEALEALETLKKIVETAEKHLEEHCKLLGMLRNVVIGIVQGQLIESLEKQEILSTNTGVDREKLIEILTNKLKTIKLD